MANLSLTRVNQKLIQAKQLLQVVDVDSLAPVHRNSLVEAVAFHLVCAYQHYVREIAETYGLKHTVGLRDESGLIKAFEAAKKHPAEADELAALRLDANSWLARLHDYYDSLWQTPKPVAFQPEEGLITLVDVDKSTAPVDIQVLQQWHADFVALIKRQRETSAEF